MARTVAGIWWPPTMEGTPALIVSTAFFGFGGIVGCFLALQSASEGITAMRTYLEHFFVAAQTGSIDLPGLASTLWRSVRWPLAVVVLGFTAVGLLGVPLLSSLRGFFLSFSITSFACAYGRRGLMMAFLLLGLPGLLAVPAFLLLSAQSFAASCCLAARGGQGRRESPYSGEYFFRCGLCGVMVALSVVVERYLLPMLLTGMAETFLG